MGAFSYLAQRPRSGAACCDGCFAAAIRLAGQAIALQRLVRLIFLLYNKAYNKRGSTVDTITYSDVRANLAKTMDRVCDDHSPVVVTRKNSRSVVMLSLRDFEALEETAFLLRSPENARRLLESVAELESGGGVEQTLSE
jgi:antitoxin YefM